MILPTASKKLWQVLVKFCDIAKSDALSQNHVKIRAVYADLIDGFEKIELGYNYILHILLKLKTYNYFANKWQTDIKTVTAILLTH